jgi:hypothetical protein
MAATEYKYHEVMLRFRAANPEEMGILKKLSSQAIAADRGKANQVMQILKNHYRKSKGAL